MSTWQPLPRVTVGHQDPGGVAKVVPIPGRTRVVRANERDLDPLPVVMPSVPRYERDEEAIRRTWTAQYPAIGAGYRISPARDRRRRRNLRVLAGLGLLSATILLAFALALMAGPETASRDPVAVWATDAAGCVHNRTTGQTVCPIDPEGT